MNFLSFLFLINISLWQISSSINVDDYINKHIDNHNRINYQSNKRNLQQADNWENIRIQFEFVDILDQYSDSIVQIYDILNIAQTYFSNNLLVNRIDTPFSFSQTKQNYCITLNIGEYLQNKIYESDIVFFVSATKTEENYIAYGGPCAFQYDMRPIFGLIMFNENMFNKEVDVLTFEKNTFTSIHEMLHVLGFVQSLYRYYYDSNTKQIYNQTQFTRNGTIYLTTPRITKYAREYFNCSDIYSIPMENEGGQGSMNSHWERRLFYNEIMTASAINGGQIMTIFTFKLLEDTGCFKINQFLRFYRLGDINPDYMTFGRNKGCNFFYRGCKGGDFDEFCYNPGKNISLCSKSRKGIGYCLQDNYSDNCSLVKILDNYSCKSTINNNLNISLQKDYMTTSLQYFSSESLCFDGQLTQSPFKQQLASCYKLQCSNDSNQLNILVGNDNLTCIQGDKYLKSNNYYGQLQCPQSIQEACLSFNSCQNQCNKKGICVNQQCTCMFGYSGKSCEIECFTYRYKNQCVYTCPPGTFVNKVTKTCLGCPFGCKICQVVGQCQQCKEGYEFNQYVCEKTLFTGTLDDVKIISNQLSESSTLLQYELNILIIIYVLFGE